MCRIYHKYTFFVDCYDVAPCGLCLYTGEFAGGRGGIITSEGREFGENDTEVRNAVLSLDSWLYVLRDSIPVGKDTQRHSISFCSLLVGEGK